MSKENAQIEDHDVLRQDRMCARIVWRSSRGLRGFSAALLLFALSAGAWLTLRGCPGEVETRRALSSAIDSATPISDAAPYFVDEQECSTCHALQVRAWQGSHHDLAMQPADASTVRGNFNDVSFAKDGARARFFRREGKYWINTDGEDGQAADFEVKYTFGVEPLQQYLVELDRGRLQAFTIAWDVERKQWFHLHPGTRIDHRDELHWTKPSQNWNFMCAECHSTDVHKNFDIQTRTYSTTWKRIDVGCQACHGPSSRHLVWARNLAKHPHSVLPPKTQEGTRLESALPTPVRSLAVGFDVDLSAASPTPQLETCARCHSRRVVIWGEYQHGKPLMDTHLPSLLEEELYYPDGQIKGEVYEYGSLLQSKMHQKGLRCSDCHDPHSLKLRRQGNELCTGCHNTGIAAARESIDSSGLQRKHYDAPSHHFHKQGGHGSQCVDCHMPSRTYMRIDSRRDHSFRIPRPDISARLDTPNACTTCHEERSAQWATEMVAKWYGPSRRQEPHFGETLSAARNLDADIATNLTALSLDPHAPPIVRASAVSLLREHPDSSTLSALRTATADASPLVRFAASGSFDAYPPQQRSALLDLLDDPVRAVRLRALASVAPLPAEYLTSKQRQQLATTLAEYEASERENSDQPAAHLNMGNVYASLRAVDKAAAAYHNAIRLNPAFVPAYVNLADLRSRAGRNGAAIGLLESAIASLPGQASLHHSLGLAYVRGKRYPEAIRELAAAAKLAPADVRFVYVYGVALHDTGYREQSIEVLEQALQRHADNRDLQSALAAYKQEIASRNAVREYTDR